LIFLLAAILNALTWKFRQTVKKIAIANNASRRTNETGPKVKMSEILVMCYFTILIP
jgi:hypothetical protein